jgi:type II secretory ATPase GspE/PulE/Tfp pilus assembly ATPase PilB-like protein
MIGVNPVFASAVRLVIGQRLVRRLDDKTKIAYEPDESERKFIDDALQDLPPNVKKPAVERLFKPGASEENPFGFAGRVVLMEQMVVSTEIQKFLRGDEVNVSREEIEQTAQAAGMTTMLQKGVLKVVDGETTIEEVSRVL